jgi:hypothetical protein
MSVPNTSELDDDQIEALIRKLSAIKGSAPELIAALEAEANSRLAKQSRGRGGRDRGGGGNANGRGGYDRKGRPVSYEEEEDDDEEEDDEEEEGEEDDEEETDSEDDDEFDEDGPCVGYGYSDEVSVISEMTTPTVVSRLDVPAEERYDEIHHGYGKKSNKPDLLSQVNRVNAAKNRSNNIAKAGPPGLNPDKRTTYTKGLAAMTKISETAETAVVTKPKTAVTTPRAVRKTPTREKSGDAKGKTPTTRGLRRDNSPSRATGTTTKKKVVATTTGKKSNHSAGSSGKGGSKQTAATAVSNDAFSDDWHKSLSPGDFNASSTDDNGFPFSFGDTDNAFASTTTSFFNNKNASSGAGDTTDPFDPFATGNGDPFAVTRGNSKKDAFGDSFASTGSGGRLASKTKSTGTRPRRASGLNSGQTRPKRDQSPRKKTGTQR